MKQTFGFALILLRTLFFILYLHDEVEILEPLVLGRDLERIDILKPQRGIRSSLYYIPLRLG